MVRRQSAAAKKKARAAARARTSRNKFSMLGTLEAVVIGSAITQGAFNMPLIPWALEGWAMPQTSHSDNSHELSAAEIVRGLVPGGASHGISSNYPGGGNITNVIMKNVQREIVPMGLTLVLAPMAFSMVRKLARRPITMFNKLLSKTGAPLKV
jgi:hypothetical protein